MSRRGWRARLVLGALGVLTFLGLAATAGGSYVLLQLSRIERHELADVLTSAPQQPVTAADVLIEQTPTEPEHSEVTDAQRTSGDQRAPDGAAEALADPAAGSNTAAVLLADQPVLPGGPKGENYLLVGTDSALGLEADDPLRGGHWDTSQLADVIMVIRLRDDGTAAIMSIPRDLAVEVAGTSGIDGAGVLAKINSAYNRDRSTAERAARLIDTVEKNLDITLQHYVEVDFEAFLRLVDAVGGVEMTFERPLRDQPKPGAQDPTDSRSGFVAEVGTQTLDGRRALAYVRSRRLQEQVDDGTWQPLGAWNDLARTARQREFMQIAAEQVVPDLLGSPRRLLSVLDIAADHLATSDTLSIVDDGRRLAADFAGIDLAKDIEEYVLRVRDVHDPLRWSLALTPDPHNQRVLDVFRGIGWDDIVESRVRVQVTGPQRQRVADELSRLGFVADVADVAAVAGVAAQNDGRSPVSTVIYLAPDGRLSAGLLASRLVPVPDFAILDDLDPNTLILHTGTQPPRINAGYRRVDVPEVEQLRQ